MSIQKQFEEMEVSNRLDEQMNQTMNQIYKAEKRRKFKRGALASGITFSCVAALIGVGISNPTYAAKIPILNRVFERVQDTMQFPGDYNSIATDVVDDGENVSENESTVNDISIEINQIYCNDVAITYAVTLTNKEMWPENENSIIGFMGTVEHSFLSEKNSIDGWYYLVKPVKIDDYTYQGAIRVPFSDIIGINGSQEIPDEFQIDLKIETIFIPKLAEEQGPNLDKTEEELDAMSEEEWKAYMKESMENDPEAWDPFSSRNNYIYSGNWDYTFDVQVDRSRTEVIAVDETNATGVGIAMVTMTEFEIDVELINPDYQYDALIIDADGKLMSKNGLSCWPQSIQGYDVSTVDIYVYDDDLWDDFRMMYNKATNCGADDTGTEIYEEYGGKTMREILEQECVYHKTVEFEK